MKGYFVIKTQAEADRLTTLKGVQRFIGECVYYGTRKDKSKLDTADYEWVPSSHPDPSDPTTGIPNTMPSDTAVWDFATESWVDGDTPVKTRQQAMEAQKERKRKIEAEIYAMQRDAAIARLKARGEL